MPLKVKMNCRRGQTRFRNRCRTTGSNLFLKLVVNMPNQINDSVVINSSSIGDNVNLVNSPSNYETLPQSKDDQVAGSSPFIMANKVDKESRGINEDLLSKKITALSLEYSQKVKEANFLYNEMLEKESTRLKLKIRADELQIEGKELYKLWKGVEKTAAANQAEIDKLDADLAVIRKKLQTETNN